MAAGLSTASITVSLRGVNGSLVDNREWAASSIDGLAAAAPWRTFRWYRGGSRPPTRSGSAARTAWRCSGP